MKWAYRWIDFPRIFLKYTREKSEVMDENQDEDVHKSTGSSIFVNVYNHVSVSVNGVSLKCFYISFYMKV